MSWRTLCFAALLFGLPHIGRAQITHPNQVKVNPFSLALKSANIAYERALSRRISVQAGAAYLQVPNGSTLATGPIHAPYKGWSLTPALRIYLSGKEQSAASGFYLSPFYRYLNVVRKLDMPGMTFMQIGGQMDTIHIQETFKVTQSSAGLTAGYQALIYRNFTLDVFAGPYFAWSDYSWTSNMGRKHFTPSSRFLRPGWGLRCGATLGYAFQ